MTRTIEMNQNDERDTHRFLEENYDQQHRLNQFEEEFLCLEQDSISYISHLPYIVSSTRSWSIYSDLEQLVRMSCQSAEMDISDAREQLKKEEYNLEERLDELYKERNALYLLEEEETQHGQNGFSGF